MTRCEESIYRQRVTWKTSITFWTHVFDWFRNATKATHAQRFSHSSCLDRWKSVRCEQRSVHRDQRNPFVNQKWLDDVKRQRNASTNVVKEYFPCSYRSLPRQLVQLQRHELDKCYVGLSQLDTETVITTKDQATRALIFLTFAMVTAFLFSLLISKFQQQLRKHVQRVHGLQNA